MRTLLALTNRELKALCYSPILYVVGALFLLLQGWGFTVLVAVMNDPRVDPSWTMAQFFFGAFFYWFSALITAPLLTMRSFSEEKRTGSLELLLTAPVTDTQVVLSKFLSAWLVYNLFWVLSMLFFVFLRTLTPFDWGPVLTGYLGTWALGAVLISIGIFASSLTRNQVIAGVLSFVLLAILFSVGLLALFIKDPAASSMIEFFSLPEHLREFARGIIDTRPLVLYLTVTALCLFFTGRVIRSPRWRT